ncbi:DUF1289 domain-containing protein [Marinobacter changyiensis]
MSVCVLDENDICTGCCRTGDEIMHWTQMSNQEKRQVLAKVAKREQKFVV